MTAIDSLPNEIEINNGKPWSSYIYRWSWDLFQGLWHTTDWRSKFYPLTRPAQWKLMHALKLRMLASSIPSPLSLCALMVKSDTNDELFCWANLAGFVFDSIPPPPLKVHRCSTWLLTRNPITLVNLAESRSQVKMYQSKFWHAPPSPRVSGRERNFVWCVLWPFGLNMLLAQFENTYSLKLFRLSFWSEGEGVSLHSKKKTTTTTNKQTKTKQNKTKQKTKTKHGKRVCGSRLKDFSRETNNKKPNQIPKTEKQQVLR